MTGDQRLVLVASILGSFVAFLDMAVVNVALPAIRAELGGGIAAQQWVVDGYLLTLGSFVLVAGSLADLFGRRRVFAVGLVGFAATSLLCAGATSPALLIGARALQGVAGALLVPSSLALIVSRFAGDAQGRAIGTWTAWTGISFILGPLVGGVLVDAGSWRWVFAINVVPVAATLLVLARVERDAAPGRRRVDLLGALLCAAGLFGVIFALIEQPARGWTSPAIAAPLAAGVVTFAAFLFHEARAAEPMLDFALFRHRNFAAGNLATVVIYAALTAPTFLLTVFLQQVGHYPATRAGLALLPVSLLMFAASPWFGRLAGKLGPRPFMTAGPLVAALGFVLLARVDAPVHYVGQLLPGVLVFGLGLAATVAPLTAAILGDIDERHAGIGSAINNAVARVAGLLAVAALGAIVAAVTARSVDDQLDRGALGPRAREAARAAIARPLDPEVPDDLGEEAAAVRGVLEAAAVHSVRVALWASAGLLAVGGLVSSIGIRRDRRRA